jgi:16S rRNA (cytosine967-C5)-methyltransferase
MTAAPSQCEHGNPIQQAACIKHTPFAHGSHSHLLSLLLLLLLQGQVLAVDISEGRLRSVERGAARLGLQSVVTCCAADLRDLATSQQQQQQQPKGPWDVVLLDAPCSGTGVLAKRADLRWRRTAEQIEELSVLQGELLDAAAELVAPGGLLVYSTCCLEPEENVEQVQSFLSRHGSRFELEKPPAGAVPEACLVDGAYLVTLPHVHGVDGAFAARLRRR